MLAPAIRHETKTPRNPSSRAGTLGNSDRPMANLLGLSPGVVSAEFLDLLIGPQVHPKADMLGWSEWTAWRQLLASQNRSDCPPASPLSITRCLSEL